jgi:hypothetical protein
MTKNPCGRALGVDRPPREQVAGRSRKGGEIRITNPEAARSGCSPASGRMHESGDGGSTLSPATPAQPRPPPPITVLAQDPENPCHWAGVHESRSALPCPFGSLETAALHFLLPPGLDVSNASHARRSHFLQLVPDCAVPVACDETRCGCGSCAVRTLGQRIEGQLGSCG